MRKKTMKYILIGCPFDNGIRSMLRFKRGITGAADGPKAVFDVWGKKFAKKYSHVVSKMLGLSKYNLNVTPKNIDDPAFHKKQKEATLTAHEKMALATKSAREKGYIPISIGGDHSVSYPLCRGVCLANPGKKFGVIYIDAHFDMRPLDHDDAVGGAISSGNPFRRIMEDREISIYGRNVVAVGIHDSGSEVYKSLENYALSKNVTIIKDNELSDIDSVVARALSIAGDETDMIYFSVDIDVVDEKFAPGASAPAHGGISDKQLFALAGGIAKDRRVVAIDIAEISSRKMSWQEVYPVRTPPTPSAVRYKNSQLEYNIFGNLSRRTRSNGVYGTEIINETENEKLAKLKKTAKLAAETIACFMEDKRK